MRSSAVASWLLFASAIALVSPAPRTHAQTDAAADLCAGHDGNRSERHCEVREASVTGQSELDLDPGRNGSVRVRGWERSDVRLRTRVEAYAETLSRARELVGAVRLSTTSGRVRSDGPMSMRDEHWSTSFHLDVPRNLRLFINTHNGGISLEAFSGAAVIRAVNGGITLRQVGGYLRGHTANGRIRVELAGQRWDGTGLDVETKNGSVEVTLPANYSAELETGTARGSVDIDFPMLMHVGRPRRFTTTLGSGGPKIRVMTTNGRVSVKRAAQ